MSNGIPTMLMRGGTSKGLYFLAQDLPNDEKERDDLLLKIMGSPDARQIDGVGGANPLTSKVAIVSKSERPDADIDYLFLQVFVDQALVSDAQNCGNILAGVGPFAIERSLISANDEKTEVRIFMENTGQIAVASVNTPNRKVQYQGNAQIDGVPFNSAPIALQFSDVEGSMCGALLPTGNNVDEVDGINVTMIDNGMPCAIIAASDLELTGYEAPEDLEANSALRERIESLRLACGPLMNLGDVKEKSVPKMTIVSAPTNGGAIHTRSFIPHKCHSTIGVMAALTVGTAAMLNEGPAQQVCVLLNGEEKTLNIEHPSGATTVLLTTKDDVVSKSAIMRTARKLMDGTAFPREEIS